MGRASLASWVQSAEEDAEEAGPEGTGDGPSGARSDGTGEAGSVKAARRPAGERADTSSAKSGGNTGNAAEKAEGVPEGSVRRGDTEDEGENEGVGEDEREGGTKAGGAPGAGVTPAGATEASEKADGPSSADAGTTGPEEEEVDEGDEGDEPAKAEDEDTTAPGTTGTGSASTGGAAGAGAPKSGAAGGSGSGAAGGSASTGGAASKSGAGAGAVSGAGAGAVSGAGAAGGSVPVGKGGASGSGAAGGSASASGGAGAGAPKSGAGAASGSGATGGSKSAGKGGASVPAAVGGGAPEPGAGTGSPSKGAEASEARAAGADRAGTGSAPGGRKTADPRVAKDEDGSSEAELPVDQPTAVFRTDRRPAVDQPTTMLKLGGSKPSDKAAEKAAGKGSGKGSGKAPDQKGPASGAKASGDKPDEAPAAEPAVDQPTTVLKVGGAKPGTKPTDRPSSKPGAKPSGGAPEQPGAKSSPKGGTEPGSRPGGGKQAAEPGEGPAAKAAAEAEAERTSKFVALKSLDELAPPKPKPFGAPAEATSALPHVGPERTTQQPLPPKPPLDLLAELTNTPPPPETPVRTLVRRVKIWTPLVALLLIIFAIAQAVRPLPAASLALTAEETYTFDGDPLKLPWPDEGQGWMAVDGVGEMDHFGDQKPVAIGSVAKTMTAYIILRDHPLKPGQEGPSIEIDPKAEKEGGYDKVGDESTLNTVHAGDHLTEKQALSAVMIPSANNIARLLARWDAGSEEAFVEKMNATAKKLGMTNTTYTDPSGLTKTTVSTAEDQVKLGTVAMRNPAMVAITSAASWTDPTGKYWTNYNELPFRVGAIGIKTGSTTAAGGNLLFAAHKKVGSRTVTIVGAVLGQHKPDILATVNAVSKTALLAAQDAPTSAKILKKGDVVGYVDDQLGGHTPVVVTEDVTAVGWAGLRVKLSLAAKDELPHTAKAGTEVGTLTVGDSSSNAVQVPVALERDLAEPGFTAKVTRLG
ncbi:D-alanyl-D-alanine carboxypeptidase [Streptomyces nodosus]|uniref:D-alanyl-D-alanine carboxypeptidase n=1 Tax=Streptomyces nodosus TaxID=40318 RepID=UPI000AFA6908|nr:D-alanyl-D-alanine carboxypeptidase [Streptomyces nodosus]MBB4792310.1 D-alanyl-D-alanine carboxypeptidase [Streptomyces nodosus]